MNILVYLALFVDDRLVAVKSKETLDFIILSKQLEFLDRQRIHQIK